MFLVQTRSGSASSVLTHRNEATSTGDHYQSQIAATMLALLGLDYRSFNPSADPPIAEAFVLVEAERR